VRDGFGFGIDRIADPIDHIRHVPTRNTTIGVRIISVRADLMSATSVFEKAALDRYTFTRDAYLQRRLNAVYDGYPPEVPAQVPVTE
jgi:phospholipid-binding lipoprotein MlaA